MEKRPSKEQMAVFKKNANDMSLSAEIRAKFQAIVDKFENVGEEVVDAVEGKKERKPRTPKAKVERKPRATKQTADDIEMAKAEIKKRTGKTEEECESIIEQYKALRTKSQERKKKEAEASKSNVARINKLKDDNKVIEGTTEKTADAVIETTTKDVAEKIEKQIEVVEKKAETEAKKEVEKQMPKVSATEKKKEVEKKVEEKVKAKTKTIVKRVVIDTSALLSSIAESLGKFDKDSQKEFLIKLRSDIDKLLAKYSYGGMTDGATQIMNIQQSNLSSSSVNPTMFSEGGGVSYKGKRYWEVMDKSLFEKEKQLTEKLVEYSKLLFYLREKIELPSPHTFKTKNQLENEREKVDKELEKLDLQIIDLYKKGIKDGTITTIGGHPYSFVRQWNRLKRYPKSLLEKYDKVYEKYKIMLTEKDGMRALKANKQRGYNAQSIGTFIFGIKDSDGAELVGETALEMGKHLEKIKKENKDILDFVLNKFSEGGGVRKYSRGGLFGESAKLEYVDDAFASDELKSELQEKLGISSNHLGDNVVISFAYTDYGGDFLDKVAIRYFQENYPENTLVENTGYNGENAYVFGEPAKEWIESTEDYPLGFENIEELYYEMQNESEYESFEYFLDDLQKYDGYVFDKDEVMSWLMENRGGYYSMTTQGLDFSYSDLTDELVSEGLIRKEEEEFGKGGGVEGKKQRILEDFIGKHPYDEFIIEKFRKDGTQMEFSQYYLGTSGTEKLDYKLPYRLMIGLNLGEKLVDDTLNKNAEFEVTTNPNGVKVLKVKYPNGTSYTAKLVEGDRKVKYSNGGGVEEVKYEVVNRNDKHYGKVGVSLHGWNIDERGRYYCTLQFPNGSVSTYGEGEVRPFQHKGMRFSKGGSVNTGRSWKLDRARHNKSENYEIPMNRRKKAHGGTIEERMRMRRGM